MKSNPNNISVNITNFKTQARPIEVEIYCNSKKALTAYAIMKTAVLGLTPTFDGTFKLNRRRNDPEFADMISVISIGPSGTKCTVIYCTRNAFMKLESNPLVTMEAHDHVVFDRNKLPLAPSKMSDFSVFSYGEDNYVLVDDKSKDIVEVVVRAIYDVEES